MPGPLPIPFNAANPGDDVSEFIGWGPDSHGRQRPAKECWGYFFQNARPYWYAGWFDEQAEFHSELWWDHSRETQTVNFTFHRPAHVATVLCPDQVVRFGLFYEFDPRPLEIRPSWAYGGKVMVDGAIGNSWNDFQRVGIFEAWEILLAACGVQYLLMPYFSGIIPIIPMLPGIITGGVIGLPIGFGGGFSVSDDASVATMIKFLELSAKEKRRKRKL
jgi:hypothetical protein